MEILTATLDVIGVLLIAYAALRVHHRVLAEHQIDNKVFKSMKIEQALGILGAVFIIAGYVLELITIT